VSERGKRHIKNYLYKIPLCWRNERSVWSDGEDVFQ